MQNIKFILILAFMSLHVSAHARKVVEQTTIQTTDGEKIQVERMLNGLVLMIFLKKHLSFYTVIILKRLPMQSKTFVMKDTKSLH